MVYNAIMLPLIFVLVYLLQMLVPGGITDTFIHLYHTSNMVYIEQSQDTNGRGVGESTASEKAVHQSGSTLQVGGSSGQVVGEHGSTYLRRINQLKNAKTWYWQLDGKLRLNVQADVYDMDGLDTPEKVIDALHNRGVFVICYFSAGTVETWRNDAYLFPRNIIGKPLAEWQDEYWLDIRRLDILLPIMKRRIEIMAQKGCDAIEPDNVDVYDNDSGFEISETEVVRYIRELVSVGHSYGLAVGLKNSASIVPYVAQYVDFAVVEECQKYNECKDYSTIVAAGKPVFAVEYEGNYEQVCNRYKRLGFIGGVACYDLNGCFRVCY